MMAMDSVRYGIAVGPLRIPLAWWFLRGLGAIGIDAELEDITGSDDRQPQYRRTGRQRVTVGRRGWPLTPYALGRWVYLWRDAA